MKEFDPALRSSPIGRGIRRSPTVIPPDHRHTVRIRIVTDALAHLFEQERAVLAGIETAS